jgi:hypothetical protein
MPAKKKEGKDYFQTIKTVSRALGTTMERDKLLDLVVRSAVETMDGKAPPCFWRMKRLTGSYRSPRRDSPGSTITPVRRGVGQVPREIMKKGYLHYRDAVSDKRLANRTSRRPRGSAPSWRFRSW